MRISAAVLLQRMRPLDITLPPLPFALVGVQLIGAGTSTEGDVLVFRIGRLGGSNSLEFTVDWVVTSEIGSSDFSGTTTDRVTFTSGVEYIDLQISTVKQGGLQGERLISLTLFTPSNGAIIDPQYNPATVVLGDYIVPPDPGLPKYQPDVPASKKHCVGFNLAGAKATYEPGYAGLLAAVNSGSYVPGDVIELEDGTYTGGDLSATRSGAASADGSQHLMIRSRRHLRAIFNFQYIAMGSYQWLSGIKMPFSKPFSQSDGANNWDGAFGALFCRRRALWVTNCECTGAMFLTIAHTAGQPADGMRICYNTLNMNIPATERNISLICLPDLPEGLNLPDNVDIAWNIIRQPTRATGTFGDNCSRSVLNIQPTKPKPNTPIIAARQSFRFHHNYLDGWFRDMWYSKRNLYACYNVCKWGANQRSELPTTQRHGIMTDGAFNIGGVMIGNLFKPPDQNLRLRLNGFGNMVRGCKLEGFSGTLHVFAGSRPTGGDVIGVFDAASWATLVENPGFAVNVGTFTQENVVDDTRGGGMPHDVRIYKGALPWNPTITFGTDFNGVSCPPSALSVNAAGYGGYDPVATITETELLNAGGADPAT